MGKFLIPAGVVLTWAATASIAAHASTAISLGTGYENFSNGGVYSIGFEFSPTTDITVTSLGDYFPAGSTTTQEVGLWTASGTLLATASVTGPGAATDGFDFTAITPVALTAGADYVVAGTNNTDEYAVYFSRTFVVGPAIDYIIHAEIPGSFLTFPTNQYSDFDVFGGNFQYSGGAAPEPSTWATLLIGFVGLGFVGWLRSRSAAAAG